MRVSFAPVLILASVPVDCASGAARGGIPPVQDETIERCIDAQSANLQSIRDKADVTRTPVDGAPPFKLSAAAPADAISAASSQQAAALERIFEASVDHLIRSLYCRELTYGERDPETLGRTLRQLVYFKISCGVYLRSLDARQPGTVHNRGALYT